METDVRFIPCRTFGGGWLEPLSDSGRDGCSNVMGEDQAFIGPIGADGYIVEPYEVEDVVTALREQGLAVTP